MRKSRAINKAYGQEGQIVIEFIVTGPLLLMALVFFSQTLYLSYADFWIQYSAYKTNICMAEQSPKKRCEREFKRRLSIGTPFGQFSDAQATNSSKKYNTKVTWTYLKKTYDYNNNLEKL